MNLNVRKETEDWVKNPCNDEGLMLDDVLNHGYFLYVENGAMRLQVIDHQSGHVILDTCLPDISAFPNNPTVRNHEP